MHNVLKVRALTASGEVLELGSGALDAPGHLRRIAGVWAVATDEDLDGTGLDEGIELIEGCPVVGEGMLYEGKFHVAQIITHDEDALILHDGCGQQLRCLINTAKRVRRMQARQLLETLLDHHPDTLPAYQILCEIYWEQGAFDRADALLASIPDELAMSLAVFALKGETLFQAGHFDVAKTFYRDFLATHGWNESIAGALARTYEALNELDHARRMYIEIMERCSGCHGRVDPLVKEKVADLSFAAGMHDTAVLELYLSLAQERPENASVYYAKVGRIYQTTGNETEARRFQALADQTANRAGRQNDSSSS